MAGDGQRMRGPDFFLVGAPKCGTTAMADYLGQHPEIGMCARKETHFLAGEQLWRRFGHPSGEPPLTDAQYLQLFSRVRDRRRLGEASVWYLYSPAAAVEIASFSPGADIVVMLRNPLEMLPSLHSQLVFVGLEPVTDFERALGLDADRERAGAPPGFPPHSYRCAVRYAEQIERYVEVFGRERIHVMLYDDFRDDPAASFAHCCGFLGVDAAFVPQIRVINANKRVRSPALRSVVRTPSARLRRAMHAVSSQPARRRVGDALNRWNARRTQRDPVSPALAVSLRPLIHHEVDALRRLLGLDASAWLERVSELEARA